MLIGVLVLYLVGGSAGTLPLTEWLDHGREYVKQEIADTVHRRDVLALMDQMEDRHKELIDAEEKTAKALHRLAEKHESRAADFGPILADYRAKTEPLQERLLNLRFQLKRQLTREQWATAHHSAR